MKLKRWVPGYYLRTHISCRNGDTAAQQAAKMKCQQTYLKPKSTPALHQPNSPTKPNLNIWHSWRRLTRHATRPKFSSAEQQRFCLNSCRLISFANSHPRLSDGFVICQLGNVYARLFRRNFPTNRQSVKFQRIRTLRTPNPSRSIRHWVQAFLCTMPSRKRKTGLVVVWADPVGREGGGRHLG